MHISHDCCHLDLRAAAGLPQAAPLGMHKWPKKGSAIPPPAPPTVPHPSEVAGSQTCPAKTAAATSQGPPIIVPQAAPTLADKSAHPMYHFTTATPPAAVWPMTFGPGSAASGKVVANLRVCCFPPSTCL